LPAPALLPPPAGAPAMLELPPPPMLEPAAELDEPPMPVPASEAVLPALSSELLACDGCCAAQAESTANAENPATRNESANTTLQ